MLSKLLRSFKRLRNRWRFNQDPTSYIRSLGIRIGNECRIYGVPEEVFGSEPYLVRLGDHVCITSGVRFSSHDGGVWVLRHQFPNLDVFGPIVVGNNVFIGSNALILPGVRIGDNVVIGAGSVVTHDIPPNCVAAGVPARVLKSLEDYKLKVLKTGLHLRSLSAGELRRRLTTEFPRIGE